MKTAIYLRVSTEMQNFDMQLNEIQNLVTERGLTIDYRYEEKESGAKADRKQLAKLMTDAKQGLFDTLVIYKLDRLGRSLKQVITTLDDLSKYGIAIISIKDNLDLSTASGRLQMQIISAMAEFEREMIRSRVIDGLKAARAKGITLGAPITIDYKAVQRLRNENKSLRAIAREMGISLGSVQNALKNF